MKTNPHSIEPLESRIAPASIVVLNDANGDHVKFTSSVGDLNGKISSTLASDGIHNVYSVNLSDPSFNLTNLTVTVTKAGGGDGQLIIGQINAGTNNLGKVSVAGDLGDIDCGNASATVAAIKSLAVKSLGRFGERGTGDNTSNINGNASSLAVKGDLDDTYFRVSGNLTSATVGGSLIGRDDADGGEIYATGNLGSVTIKQDIRGGDGPYSGSVGAGGNVTSVKVGGSVFGGSGDNSGDIFAAFTTPGTIGKVSIGHSLVGGQGGQSGVVGGEPAAGGGSAVSLTNVSIGGDIVGGSGDSSGSVAATLSALARLTVKGSLVGGLGQGSGYVLSSIHGGTISFGGSIYGGTGNGSASFTLNGLDSLTIGGSLLGGHGTNSGAIYSNTAITFFHLHGDVRGAAGNSSGSILAGGITTKRIDGAIIPGTGTDSGTFVA